MAKWFSARLALACHVGSDDEPLYDDRIHILVASSEEEALDVAESIGRAQEHSYLNEAGETVRWIFERVLEVQALDTETLEHGAEVYSHLTRTLPPVAEGDDRGGGRAGGGARGAR